MSLSEILAKIGLKIILLALAASVVCFGILFYFSYLSTQPSAVKMENSPYYDNATGSIVLANNTASLSGTSDCNVFVSGPSKRIKFLETVGCDSLSATEISKQVLLDMFDGQKGTYTIIISSQEESRGQILQFSIA